MFARTASSQQLALPSIPLILRLFSAAQPAPVLFFVSQWAVLASSSRPPPLERRVMAVSCRPADETNFWPSLNCFSGYAVSRLSLNVLPILGGGGLQSAVLGRVETHLHQGGV